MLDGFHVDSCGKVLSYLVTAACAGDALVPMGQGFALNHNPTLFVLVGMVVAICATSIFFVLEIFMAAFARRQDALDSVELISPTDSLPADGDKSALLEDSWTFESRDHRTAEHSL